MISKNQDDRQLTPLKTAPKEGSDRLNDQEQYKIEQQAITQYATSKKVEQVENIRTEVILSNQRNPSQSRRNPQSLPQVTLRVRKLRQSKNDPGSSKNFPKNIGSRLQKFIEGSFKDIDMVWKDQIVQDFFNKDSESINKGDLNRLKASPYGAQILRLFFGDYIWAADCIAGKKMELTQALIINQMWCDEL